MRKFQQKNILGVLKTISDAQTNGLYADCQDGALAIGGFINDIMGEGTQTVALLEEYCDLLYQACNGKTSVKSLHRQIIKIENSVRSELKPTNFEIVFLPYKVSMWDSLESIYLAAMEDPDCKAYVVPIPSYELNPDDTLGQMYYDGDLYPENIPIIHWQDYDIEARQPDVIFIHYAYDDMVSNATVHPAFYSERLRQNCEQLIYVPYFVNNNETHDYNSLLPGVRNAHHVIVQSKAIKKSYIKHYLKFDKENGWKGRYGAAEDKFVALGSPKFDKVLNSKREDFTIPDEWIKLINNPDGTQKKTILYNTHMFTWINNGEKYFKKIRSVFETFKNRDDVVLWWRPHPNTELNFRTQAPQLFDEYKDVVDNYRNEGWGIYDESPDLHRAMAWSDAYYGDESSLAIMYKITGKPVMIQNINYLNNNLQKNQINVAVIDFDFRENILWLLPRNIDELFSMNLDTGETRSMGEIPGNKEYGDPLYTSIVTTENNVFIIPYKENSVLKFNILSNSYDSIFTVNTQKNIGKFMASICYNETLYIFPIYYNSIVKYDLITGIAVENDKLCNELEKYRYDDKAFYFTRGLMDNGDKLFLTTPLVNIIIIYDMQTDNYDIHHIGKSENSYATIVYDGKYFWLFPLNGGAIVKWDGVSNNYEELCDYPDKHTPGDEYVFISAVIYDKFIYAFPQIGNMVLKIDITTNNIEEFINLEERKKHCVYNDDYTFKYTNAKLINNYIFAISLCENALHKIDPNTGEIESVPIVLSDEDYVKFMDKLPAQSIGEPSAQQNLIMESLILSPEYLIERMKSDTITLPYSPQENIDGNCGNRIFEFAKSKII